MKAVEQKKYSIYLDMKQKLVNLGFFEGVASFQRLVWQYVLYYLRNDYVHRDRLQQNADVPLV